MRRILCGLCGAFMALSASAAEPSDPCAASEFRQLDFWLGEWDVTWEDGGHGTNMITRTLDGCVIHEKFIAETKVPEEFRPLHGLSLSTYHVPMAQWRQTWADNAGGYFDFTGGPQDGGFVLTLVRLNENAPHRRMVFEDIKPDSLTWRWQSGGDDGKTWSDIWVIHYTKRR